MKNNEQGRSMIEMLGVLAIIGVLSVGGIAGYSKAMMRYRINKTIEQISLIVGNTRTFFKGNYEDIISENGMDIIRKAKLVPDEMWNNEKTALENVFGGYSFLDVDVDDSTYFDIELRNIPQEGCIELASQDWSNDFVSIEVISGTPYPPFGGSDCNAFGSTFSEGYILACKSDHKLPIHIDDAILGCNCSECIIRFYAK